MSYESDYNKSLGDLRAVLTNFKPGQKTYDEIVGTRDQVLAKYGPVFSRAHTAVISREEFSSFLYFENNHHWSGLYRKGLGAADNINLLRQALDILLNEDVAIQRRFPEAIAKVPGLGKALATAILTVAFPQKYGVWNNTSEAALLQLNLFPESARGEGIGRKYAKINAVLLRLCEDLSIDLWTLDALWWFLLEPDRLPPTSTQTDSSQQLESFGLEKQLEDFLLENWERTILAKEWDIYSEPNDPEAGNQYPTDVGRIDILAQHKHEARFLVIELKRSQTTDQTIGQALRYVGWVKQHLATSGQNVEALIISHRVEKEAFYAISTLTNVKMMTYQIDFHLKDVEPLTPK